MTVASPVTGTPAVGDPSAEAVSVATGDPVATAVSVAAIVAGGSKVGSAVGVVAGAQAVTSRAIKSIAPSRVGYFILSHSFQEGRLRNYIGRTCILQ
jgi:hypothetical protein